MHLQNGIIMSLNPEVIRLLRRKNKDMIENWKYLGIDGLMF